MINYLRRPYISLTNDKTRPKNPQYYKLPYTGQYLEELQEKITKIYRQFCESAKINIVYNSFKISKYFFVKKQQPHFRSFLLHKFVWVKCNSCYIESWTQNPRRLTSLLSVFLLLRYLFICLNISFYESLIHK